MSAGRRFGIRFVGSDAFPSLVKETLNDFLAEGNYLAELGRVNPGQVE